MYRFINNIHNNFRMVLIGFCLLLVFGICILSNIGSSGRVSASTSNQKYFICIEICEGDTLWSIADTYISEEYSNVEEYVDEIKELNDLNDNKIYCGATLVVPYYAP